MDNILGVKDSSPVGKAISGKKSRGEGRVVVVGGSDEPLLLEGSGWGVAS